MLVHHSDLGRQPALEDGAQKLFFALEMPKQGNFVDTCFSGNFAGSRPSDTVPGEGLRSSIQQPFARQINGRNVRTFPFQSGR